MSCYALSPLQHDSSFFGLADIPGLAEQHFSLDGTPEPSPHSSARTERSCSRPALARAGSSGRSLLGNCWPWGQPTAHMASMVGHPSRAADYAVPGLELVSTWLSRLEGGTWASTNCHAAPPAIRPGSLARHEHSQPKRPRGLPASAAARLEATAALLEPCQGH